MYYPMKLVTQKTGLRSETLRAWERRYSGIRPERDSRGHRIYSEALLEKLILLSILVDQGFRIGDIADHRIEDLRLQVDQLSSPKPEEITPEPSNEKACRAALAFDDTRVWFELERAALAYGRLEMIDGFIFPVLRDMNTMHRDGSARDVHLRFLTSCMRTFLSTLLMPAPRNVDMPNVVIAYPLAQHSDLGGIAAAVHAQAAGWHPIFLGDSVPAEQIVQAAVAVKAEAVIISAVTSTYSAEVLSEVKRIQSNLPAHCPVYFGGRIPEPLRDDLQSAGTRNLRTMRQLREELESLLEARATREPEEPASPTS